VAGVPLDENFDYASTTREIDYAKYLGYAGLALEPPVERPEAYAGAIVEDRDGRLVVAALEPRSPAAATLLSGDVLVEVDGARLDAEKFDALVAARHPGDRLPLAIERSGKRIEVALALGHRLERTFRITPVAAPSALQAAILGGWSEPPAR
jgi:predicted metalloprotease with PDZ domain